MKAAKKNFLGQLHIIFFWIFEMNLGICSVEW